jgi:hypothetical protein
VTVAYVCRLLPLTCMAPDIVEAILDGRQAKVAEARGGAGERATWRGSSSKAFGDSLGNLCRELSLSLAAASGTIALYRFEHREGDGAPWLAWPVSRRAGTVEPRCARAT